jgi:xanthine dehydrogenase YagT iron-sulfur-binding subunit
MEGDMKMGDTFNPRAALAAAGEEASDSSGQHTSSDAQERFATESGTTLDRRAFLKKTTLAGGSLVLVPGLLTTSDATTFDQPATGALPSSVETVAARLRVNGTNHDLHLDPRTSLLDLMREQLGLTGTKKGCNHGQCGACTVLVNGRRINSCLALAVVYDGSKITTVEGLARGKTLHPLQAAFVRHDGFQCGYCTSGQICSAVGMLQEVEQGTASHVTPDVRKPGRVELTDEEIRERMSGNICRCGAYPGIVAAVREASGKSRKGA